MKRRFIFKSELWLYPGVSGSWHFVSLPKTEEAQIKKHFGAVSIGWGSVRVEAKIGKTVWKTSIFPDKKRGTYLLPVKADVRKRESLRAGDTVRVDLSILQ